MAVVKLATASSKGQVIIPQDIRDELGVEEGTRFAVYGKGDTIVFKVLELPSVKDFEKAAAFGRKFAKEKVIQESDLYD